MIVSHWQTLSFPRNKPFSQKINLSKQQIPQDKLLHAQESVPTQWHFSPGQLWHSWLLFKIPCSLYKGTQPLCLAHMHVLFIKKVSINIQDKKHAHK